MKYEITREQIIELSLRSDKASIWLQQNFKDAFKNPLEAGKWYKCIEEGFESLICITNYENNEAYGFSYYGKNDKNIWCENGNLGWSFKSDSKNWIEATEQEVFEALKNEAVRLGFINGAYYQWINCPLRSVFGNEFVFEGGVFRINGFTIMDSEGKWAEIIPVITKQEAEALLNKKIV